MRHHKRKRTPAEAGECLSGRSGQDHIVFQDRVVRPVRDVAECVRVGVALEVVKGADHPARSEKVPGCDRRAFDVVVGRPGSPGAVRQRYADSAALDSIEGQANEPGGIVKGDRLLARPRNSRDLVVNNVDSLRRATIYTVPAAEASDCVSADLDVISISQLNAIQSIRVAASMETLVQARKAEAVTTRVRTQFHLLVVPERARPFLARQHARHTPNGRYVHRL